MEECSQWAGLGCVLLGVIIGFALAIVPCLDRIEKLESELKKAQMKPWGDQQ